MTLMLEPHGIEGSQKGLRRIAEVGHAKHEARPPLDNLEDAGQGARFLQLLSEVLAHRRDCTGHLFSTLY
jgi:hypothetical protein